MTKHCLITRTNHDRETSYLYSFSKAIVTLAKDDLYIQLTTLEGKNVTRKKFENALQKSKPKLVFLNGHGDYESVWGHNDKIILDRSNIKLTTGKIIYALACGSLLKLGDYAVENGTEAYVGYQDDFMCVGDPARSSTPDKDKNSAPFRRVCHVLIKSLMDGTPVEKAVEKTKEEYKKLIKTYGTSEDEFGDAPAIGLALSWNLMFLGFKGNPKSAF